MTSRFEKFSERARRVLTSAQEEAQALNHSYIGTEHILLGLVREEEGVEAFVGSRFHETLEVLYRDTSLFPFCSGNCFWVVRDSGFELVAGPR